MDEIQENAPVDVPITIFFCTKRKRANFIEAILADRDRNIGNVSDRSQEQISNPLTDRSGNADERGERIEEIIQQTINKYQAFRNIHIQQGNNEKTLIKYKQSFLSEKNKNFDLGPN